MDNLQILLRQHVGKPCAPIVKVGDHVKKGQLIAEPTGLGANIFASVYGVVEEITEDRIIIKADEEQPAEFVPIDVPEDASKLDMVKAAGVVGLGGAGFPTGIKLSIDLAETPLAELDPEINPELPADFKLDCEKGYILINAAECEPGLAHNVQQILDETDKVVAGVKYCMEIANADKAIFGIKKKHKEAILKLQDAIKDEPGISIHMLPDIYPMGEERAIVRECLGINLTPAQLPSAAKSVVVNLETVAKVAEAIDEKKPCFEKNLTVRGRIKGGNEAHVFMNVPVGTSVRDLIEMAGGIEGEYGEIILGGAFTGKACELTDPIVKQTGAILVTMPFMDLKGANMGILVCACGGNLERMEDLAKKYNTKVASVAYCKQAIEMPNGTRKCLRPGNCPGQVKNNMQFKKDKCEYIIIGNCSDCSNTVMASGPKMGLKVLHQTDHAMRAVGHALYRTLRVSKQVAQDLNVIDNQ